MDVTELVITVIKNISGQPLTPWVDLTANDFKLKKSGTEDRIYFSNFEEKGNGSYLFGGFQEYVNGTLTDLTSQHKCTLFINDTIRPEYGSFPVGPDATVVKRTGDEDVDGTKTFLQNIYTKKGGTTSLRVVTVDELESYLTKSGGQLTGSLDANGQEILNLPLSTEDSAPVRVVEFSDFSTNISTALDGKLSKASGGTVTAVVAFHVLPTLNSDPENGNQATRKDWVQARIDSKVPYQVFRGIINHTDGEDDVFLTELENTTEGTISAEKTAESGKYQIGSSNNAFTLSAGTSYCYVNAHNGSRNIVSILATEHYNAAFMYLRQYDAAGSALAGLKNVRIEILIYSAPQP